MRTYLGVDGGGSKTLFLLIDETGKVLASHTEGTAYYPEVGLEALKKLLARGINQILRQAGLTDVGDASVYGTLRRLFAAGALNSYVLPSDEGPHRKYYGINAQGRAMLAAWPLMLLGGVLGAAVTRWDDLAFLFGGKMAQGGQMGDMVMWTSSASRQFGGGLNDWLTPTQVAGLVRDRTVMAPTTTSCLIPAEVRSVAPDFRMGTLTAFGPEADFSYPARPANPKEPWNLQWTARVRYRSSTSWMDMPGMPGQAEQQQQEAPKKCKPRGLGGFIKAAAGAGSC